MGKLVGSEGIGAGSDSSSKHNTGTADWCKRFR